MKEVVRKEILFDLTKAIEILSQKDTQDLEELKALSNHAIEDVAVQKDLDLISMTVLLYSIYKVVQSLQENEYQALVQQLRLESQELHNGNLGKYNPAMVQLYKIVKKGNASVREHLQDVMQAARIKKGTALLEHGLSIGQAAGLMGLSNWDLQQYAAKTTALEHSYHGVRAKKRLQLAWQLFGMRGV